MNMTSGPIDPSFRLIKSIEYRNRLTLIFKDINQALDSLRITTVDKALSDTIKSFLQYLARLSKSPEKSNIYAKWMVTYADCIYQKLMLETNKTLSRNSAVLEIDDTLGISKLIILVCQFRVWISDPNYLDKYIIDILYRLIPKANLIHESKDPIQYTNIKNYIDGICVRINHLLDRLSSGIVIDQDDISVYTELVHLEWLLFQYSNKNI